MQSSSSSSDPFHSVATPDQTWIQSGTATYYRAGLALFLVGFASFSLIYCVQPLLPAFTQSFAISPANSALALSLTTVFLAISIVLSSAFSQALGRRNVIFTSMACAAILNILAMFIPHWQTFLITRALEGLVLGGVPAVTMAWIAEEMDPKALAQTMGLYIAGTAFGGMMGRVGMGMLIEWVNWQTAMGILGVLCLLCAFGFLSLLPPSRHFVQKKGINLGFHLQAWRVHLENRQLLRLYAMGFLLTSIFVTLFNYITFRLDAAPYLLSQTQISLIFLSYSLGMLSSSLAGGLAQRFGRQSMLILGLICMGMGIICTLAPGLWSIIFGIALITTGFFIAHALCSGLVGAAAQEHKGHATSLYLLFYYLGSSIIGSAGGWFWLHAGWSGIVLLALTLLLAAIGLCLIPVRPQPSTSVGFTHRER